MSYEEMLEFMAQKLTMDDIRTRRINEYLEQLSNTPKKKLTY